MIARVSLLSALLLFGCTEEPPPPAATPPVLTPVANMHVPRSGPPEFVDSRSIRWRLRGEPTHLTMANRNSFRLTIEATNEGESEVDPQRHHGQWLFQGESHFGLSLWFGNGLRANEWSALPPGMTVTDSRTPGESLFEEPGEYEIAYAQGPGRIAIVRVVVDP